MTYDDFLKKYGTCWKKMFELLVWNVPPMRDWLRINWNAVYHSIGKDGIDGTPEFWLMLAYSSAIENIHKIISEEKKVI